MTAAPERVYWFTATELEEREEKIRAEVRDEIGRRLEAEADDYADGCTRYGLTIAVRLAREHAPQPAQSTVEPSDQPDAHSATETPPGCSQGALAVDPGEA